MSARIFGFILTPLIGIFVVGCAFSGWEFYVCRSNGFFEAIGWGFMLTALMPFAGKEAFPFLLLVPVLAPIFLFSQTENGATVLRMILVSPLVGLIVFWLFYLLAFLLHASARCSIGF